jgi:hypothetical protein
MKKAAKKSRQTRAESGRFSYLRKRAVSMASDLEDYKTCVDIFKGYLDTALTAHIWFYAITGAIASYYLTNPNQYSYVRYSLILPFLLGCALAYTSFIGMSQASALKTNTKNIATKLKIETFPPIDILRQSLFNFGILDVLIIFGLGFLFFFISPISNEQ